MIVSGKFWDLIFLLVICGVTYLLMRSTWVPRIRRIPAFDAIEEAIGRATELGKPVHLCPGTGSLNNVESGPALIAGFAVLSYAVGICARLDTRPVIAIGSSDALALVETLVRQAYQAQGKLQNYDPNVINYFPGRDTIGNSLAFTNSTTGLIARTHPATNIMIGPFYGEQIALCEVAAREEAIQICGTQSLTQTSVMAAVSDYFIVAEEIFAAGAYVTQDPIQLKSIAGGDFAKAVAITLIIIGVILELLGNSITGIFAG
jgi:hypothetical protein